MTAVVKNELGEFEAHHSYFKLAAAVMRHPQGHPVIEIADVVLSLEDAETLSQWLARAAQAARTKYREEVKEAT